MSLKFQKLTNGPVDYAIHSEVTIGAADITYDESLGPQSAGVPLIRRRIQVVAEVLAGGTFDVSVRPLGAAAFVAVASAQADGANVWIHAGGSVGGVLIDAIKVSLSKAMPAARVIIASVAEGL